MRKGTMLVLVYILAGSFTLTAVEAMTVFTPTPAAEKMLRSKVVEMKEGFQVERPYTILGIIRTYGFSHATATEALEEKAREIGADALLGVKELTPGEFSAWAILYQDFHTQLTSQIQ